MFSRVVSGTIYGLQGFLVEVEVDFSQGLPCFVMVGSLKSEVKESAERVRIALKNNKITIPPMHIAVNLSPADIKKSGTGFDLPVAVGVLCSMGLFDEEKIKDTLILGELGLNGEIKRVNGVMPIVWEAKRQGITKCIVPVGNSDEALLVPGVEVLGASDINQVLAYLNAEETDKELIIPTLTPRHINGNDEKITLDFDEVKGQENIKRGALIAVSGNHHMLIMGPPGTGKTMIARRIPTILPPMTEEECMEVTSIYSIAGKLTDDRPVIRMRPFVSPHHTVSPAGLVGGGAIPMPGAISLAHKGVLFLDELPEFHRNSIDLLREPLEEKKINISRAAGAFVYPADIMLVAAMNPCPCGYYPDTNKCNCTPWAIKQYVSNISGPILDRIDLCLTVNKVKIKDLDSDGEKNDENSNGEVKCRIGVARDMRNMENVERKLGKLENTERYLENLEKANHKDMNAKGNVMNTEAMLKRVLITRDIQKERFKNEPISCNSQMGIREIEKFCLLSPGDKSCVENICDKMDISVRGYHRLLRVSRTIADIEESDSIRLEHVMEAIGYRPQILGN